MIASDISKLNYCKIIFDYNTSFGVMRNPVHILNYILLCNFIFIVLKISLQSHLQLGHAWLTRKIIVQQPILDKVTENNIKNLTTRKNNLNESSNESYNRIVSWHNDFKNNDFYLNDAYKDNLKYGSKLNVFNYYIELVHFHWFHWIQFNILINLLISKNTVVVLV